MSFNCAQEAIGLTNELFNRSGSEPRVIGKDDALLIRETIERALHAAFQAGIRSKPRALLGALLWLRNHCEVGKDEDKAGVLVIVDRILESNQICMNDQRLFREQYLSQ